MKNIYHLISIAFLVALFNFTNAQTRDYIPLLNEGAHWLETYYHTPTPYGYNQAAKLFFAGDTTINSKQYAKIYKGLVDIFCQDTYLTGPEFAGALREDIAGQKVWIVEPGESQESLYFDFTLGVGDTVPEDSHFIEDFSPVVVYDIDTVTGIDGVARRQWTFEHNELLYGSQIIEGIGNINGMMSSYFIQFEHTENLYCFSVDTNLIFSLSGPYTCRLVTDTCLTVGIPESHDHTQTNHVLSVYPVPASAIVYLQFENKTPADETLLQIMDFSGKVVYKMQVEENNNKGKMVNVSSWPRGIYIATIFSKGQLKGKCKILVNR